MQLAGDIAADHAETYSDNAVGKMTMPRCDSHGHPEPPAQELLPRGGAASPTWVLGLAATAAMRLPPAQKVPLAGASPC